MEQSPVKQEKKFNRRSFKSAKSATLPAGAVLTQESGEGFFSKIRRSFKIRRKGKFVLPHSHDDTEVPGSARLSQSSDSLKHTEAGNRETRGVFKANVTPQESLQENKSVVLVSSEPQKCSAGASDRLPPTGERAPERAAGLVSDTAQIQSQAEQAAAVAVPEETTDISLEDEDNNNDKFFDDFDPDYETLDNIRRKLQVRNNSDQNSATNQADSSHAGAEDREMVQDKVTEGRGRKEQGIGELPSDAIQCMNMNSREMVSSVSSTGSRGSLESQSCVSAVEEDLYANAKILKRKQLRRASEQPRVEVNAQPHSESSFASSGKHGDCQQRESSQSACPPPLPARNYSEKDMITTVDRTPFSKDLDCGAVIENGTLKSAVTVSAECSDQHQEDGTPVKVLAEADARIKANTPNSKGKDSKLFRRDSAFIELGPILILNSNHHSCQGNNCCNNLSHTQSKFPCAQGPQTVFTSADSSFDDVTEKCCDKSELQTSQEHKTFEQIEDDLLFIDEDQAQDSNCHVNTSGVMDCDGDVGPTEVPSTVCGSDHFYISSEGSKKTDAMTGDHDSSPAVMPATPEAAQAMTRSQACKSQSNEQHSAKREPKCHQHLKDNNSHRSGSSQSTCSTEKTSPPNPTHRHSLSSSQKSSASQTSPAPSPPPVSHNATGRAVGDRVGSRTQEDDARPQVRPRTSHLKQRFLQSSGSAHSEGEIPPPLPALRGTAGRKVVSEELPKTRAKESDQESCKNRRHSSAVDASRAHNDFLTSMKQLKECGWYWGPLSCEEAVEKLKEKCDGSFLVRDSASDKYLLAISFKHGHQVHHTRIEFHKGLFSFFERPDEHSKAHICQFIEQTVEHSRRGNYIYFQRSPTSRNNPLSIQLLYPVSRFQRVPSLQHICRFLILCRVRRDHIYKLPLPEKVKGYLSEKQYYVEMLTEDP